MQEHYFKELEKILKEISEAPAVEEFKQDDSFMQSHREEIEKLQQENSSLLSKLRESEHKIQEYESKMHGVDEQLELRLNHIKFLENETSRALRNEKRLRNEILDLKGNVRVYCRIRPHNLPPTASLRYSDREISLENKTTGFDRVFSSEATQYEIFSEMELFVENVIDGYKLCIFAYGQTGSGKTHTMEGNGDGLIYNSLYKLKEALERIETTYTLKYVEIYNENIIDLFTKEKVTLQHDGSGIKLKNVTEHNSANIEEIIEHMKVASKSRRIAETKCNTVSSRSHALFILTVNMKFENETRTGSLCLIDLAGSERVSSSKVENERLKETQCINKSLSALGNVFTSIKRKESHVPYRDSKLTHAMQEYLTGDSRTVMIVNLNPGSVDESICTLRFAGKVSECDLGRAEKNVERKK